MTELVATYSRRLRTTGQIYAHVGIVSGRRYYAYCKDCMRKDHLTFTSELSAKHRLAQHDCGSSASPW